MWWPTAVLALILVSPVQESARGVETALAAAEQAALVGQHREAVASLERLLTETGPSHPLRARVLDALGASEVALGTYGPAVLHADEAARLFATQGDQVRQSGALNRVGLARLYAAEYPQAATAFRAAVELSRALGAAAAEAEQVTNLGNVSFFLGRYAEAALAYDAALALTAVHAGEPWTARRRRLTLVNQATLDQRLGRDREALVGYQQIDTSGADLRPREHAQILANLGVLYRRLGDPIKAIETYDRALALFEADQLLDGELGVIKNRGIALALDLGDFVQADAAFTRAFNRATAAGNRREILQALIYRGETRRRLRRHVEAGADFTAGLAIARELGTPEEEWKALFGLGRVDEAAGQRGQATARYVAAVDVIESLRERIRVPTMRSDFFSDKREVYDHLIRGLVEAGAPASRLFSVLERSHSRAWRDRLGLSASPELDQVQARLPAGTVLLEYWFSELGSAVIVIGRDRVSSTSVTATAAEVAALNTALTRPDSADWPSLARTLGSKLVPVGALGDATHVAIVVDGALSLVPFDVLTVNDRLLIEQAAVSYLPTAALLLANRPAPESWRAPWRTVLTAFADPIAPAARLDRPAAFEARLAASALEVRQIASELGGRSHVLTGAANQKAALLSRLGDAPILHLATHAIADGDALEQSRILFSPADDDASHADYLFVREAYDLPLSRVELAVLSACDTSRGRLVRGEGVQSFSRAFLAAGARSTVTTLWRVADEPTAQFMQIFYRGLQEGAARGEALRRAKLAFLTSGTALADPHFWAAFVLAGDGALPVPRTMQTRTLVVGAAVVVALGGALVFSRRRRR